MVPHPIQRYAQKKHLGMFEKTYSESPSKWSPIGIVVSCVFLSFFIPHFLVAIGIALAVGILLWIIGTVTGQSHIVQNSNACLSFPLRLLTWPRRSYLQNKQEQEKWLHVYTNGFIYQTPSHTQAYHISEILSVELHQKASGSKDHVHISTFYRIYLDGNREAIQTDHGAEIKYNVELYQHRLLQQFMKQGGTGNTP